MGLPAKLKNFNFSVDGTSYLGETTEVTQPKLAMQRRLPSRRNDCPCGCQYGFRETGA